MLSGLERKTAWPPAEHAGEAAPDGTGFLPAKITVRDDGKCHRASDRNGRKRSRSVILVLSNCCGIAYVSVVYQMLLWWVLSPL